jgi:hypothetical protein
VSNLGQVCVEIRHSYSNAYAVLVDCERDYDGRTDKTIRWRNVCGMLVYREREVNMVCNACAVLVDCERDGIGCRPAV